MCTTRLAVARNSQTYGTGLYQLRIQLQNVAHDDGLKSPKHVEHLMIDKDAL